QFLDTSLTIGATVFPNDSNRVEVVHSIKQPYTSPVQIPPNKYVPQTSSPFNLHIIIQNPQITTPYPKYTTTYSPSINQLFTS
ncbi:hypothetical protein, partial [Bacillus thuringiensis]|uniref:hypothetical protein n=1 Tax=Bacillus thuringiensis TaxID=1428 RepID=UPI001C930A97